MLLSSYLNSTLTLLNFLLTNSSLKFFSNFCISICGISLSLELRKFHICLFTLFFFSLLSVHSCNFSFLLCLSFSNFSFLLSSSLLLTSVFINFSSFYICSLTLFSRIYCSNIIKILVIICNILNIQRYQFQPHIVKFISYSSLNLLFKFFFVS